MGLEKPAPDVASRVTGAGDAALAPVDRSCIVRKLDYSFFDSQRNNKDSDYMIKEESFSFLLLMYIRSIWVCTIYPAKNVTSY